MFSAHYTFRHLAALVAVSLGLGGIVCAQGPSAKATLSSETVAVGDSVELKVQVTGASRLNYATNLNVDGLSISEPQMSQMMSFGGAFESGITLIFNVTAERQGTFTIPALRFRADGRPVETQPVSLKVEPAKPGGSGVMRVAFAEIVLPKQTAYVGELLPTEIRLYVDSAIKRSVEQMPTFEGEGFTKSKLSQPRGDHVMRDGRKYDVFVFETAITPSKAGKIEVGPAEFEFLAQIPRARPARSRSPLDDAFGGNFFDDFPGMFGRTEKRKAVAEAVELTVKPLPAQNRPANFSGAVGKFSLSGTGSPSKVKIGDPITMKLEVRGSGNFARVTAPVLADAKGWRAYPPSENFKADDETESHGVKTFEVAVIPEAKKAKMPVFEFSYFDPTLEKYATTITAAAPVTVEGEPPPMPPPVVHGPSSQETAAPPAPNAPAPPAPLEVTDIHGISYDFGTARSFEPLYNHRGFVALQFLPAGVVGGAMVLRFWKPKPDAGRVASLRRERAAQSGRLQHEGGRSEFYDGAARVLQLDTALITGQLPEAVDAAAVCRARRLDAETVAVVEDIFHARAEALYAGSGSAPLEELPDSERRRVLGALTQFTRG